MKDKQQAMLLAAAWGFAIWVIIGVAANTAESWDSPIYILAGLPMLAIGAAVLGWFFPASGWRCGIAVTGGHGLAMVLTGIQGGMGFGLIPFTTVLLLILGLPMVLAAFIGAFLKRKKTQE